MSAGSGKCPHCGKTAYLAEATVFDGEFWHKGCFRCAVTDCAPGSRSPRARCTVCSQVVPAGDASVMQVRTARSFGASLPAGIPPTRRAQQRLYHGACYKRLFMAGGYGALEDEAVRTRPSPDPQSYRMCARAQTIKQAREQSMSQTSAPLAAPETQQRRMSIQARRTAEAAAGALKNALR